MLQIFAEFMRMHYILLQSSLLKDRNSKKKKKSCLQSVCIVDRWKCPCPCEVNNPSQFLIRCRRGFQWPFVLSFFYFHGYGRPKFNFDVELLTKLLFFVLSQTGKCVRYFLLQWKPFSTNQPSLIKEKKMKGKNKSKNKKTKKYM